MLKQNNTPQSHNNKIIKITTIITEQNYFIFNKYYTQPEALPMGSPISSILAKIFIHDIVQTHIINKQNNKYGNKIIYWYRYVDDILLLYNGNSRQTRQLHQCINKPLRKLNFTLETEVNKSMMFLDLTVTKTDNRDTFNICRKPTTTITVIHNTSNHPTQHKHATFHSMVNRHLNVHLNQTDYNTKVNTIKYIAQGNGYDLQLIKSLIKNAK
jgi:Reverse transcriptase (RNA-dependent DNA polymerase).